MPGKATILGLKLADCLRLNGPARVHYHLGHPNFGDDINLWFLRQVSGIDFRWGAASRPHLLGIGSILGKATGESWVWGSGFIMPPERPVPAPARVIGVRGRLSAEILGARPAHLGDPVCLIDRLLTRPEVRPGSLGIVPHVTQVACWRRRLAGRPEFSVIDPAGDPVSVVRAIAACERVASQSLHGLIVADAYGIPAVWLEPSGNMMGGAFKFRDHFTSMDRARDPVALDRLLASEPLPWQVSAYRGDKDAYLAALGDAARELAGAPLR